MVDKVTIHLTEEELSAVIDAVEEKTERLEEHADNYVKDEESLEETKSAIKYLESADIKFIEARNEMLI